MELGFPKLQVDGLEKLQSLSALLVCGFPEYQRPALPKALAAEPDEGGFDEAEQGQMIARRAVVAGSGVMYRLNAAMSMDHRLMVLDPSIFLALTDKMVTPT